MSRILRQKLTTIAMFAANLPTKLTCNYPKKSNAKTKFARNKWKFSLTQEETLRLEFETQCYRAVRYILLISEFFVCAPMGAHRQHVPPNRSDCLWRTLQMLHLIWCLIVYGALSACVYTEYTESNIDLPTVQKPLYFCEYLVYLIHIFQIIVSIYYAKHKFRNFISTVIDIDQQLHSFHVMPNYQLVQRFCHWHLLLVLIHLVATAIIDYFYSDCVAVSFLRSLTVYMLPNIILEISLVQYYAVLYVIATRSWHLNSILKRKLYEQHINGDALHTTLQRIRLLYSKLELFTAAVNEAFAQSVVLVYIGSLMNISVNIFLIYKYMDNIAASTWAMTLYSVIWTLMHIGKMFLILYYNQSIQNQKNTTALLLNDFKNCSTTMEETITHFILQLILNTRSNVVCGVAVLNMEFITSLLVAISTLFIFLLQYDITFEALTNMHKSANPIKE